MLEREADLRLVRTADRTLQYVLAENLEEFRKTKQIVEEQPAWEGGRRGVLTAERARAEGFCKAIVENPGDLARIYQISNQSSIEDPTLGQTIRPMWIKINGPLDTVKVGYLTRRIEQARQERVNLIFFRIDSPGGLDSAADSIADLIAAIQDMKTVAYIDDRALGVAALLPLACRDIVFQKTAKMGDVRQIITGRNGQTQNLSETQIHVLAQKASFLARAKGHPEAVARALVDPAAEIIEARDLETGAVRLLGRAEAEADRGRFQVIGVRKEAGRNLTPTGDEAASFGLGQVVNTEVDL
jgi:membrane-bound serine protease (ClpP class)